MSAKLEQLRAQEIAVGTGQDETQAMGSTRLDRSDMDRMGKIQELKVCALSNGRF
ncbi:hypothetical protein Plec18167_009672 [Paecilomyces lecythidis]|uniref:Uncharacterized protein n=1 Tax=Paecilomyces lecythidis TaxID=3004212 RepID=A0ABR3WMJ0_9EURO